MLSNADLEKMVDTNDEWIRTRTGISERRILKDPEKATSDMASEVIKGLCAQRGISPEEVDLVIVATVTPDMFFPSTAQLACHKSGCTNAWGFDLSAACSGFLYALRTGGEFVASGTHKKVIVASADKMSSIVDYTDAPPACSSATAPQAFSSRPTRPARHGRHPPERRFRRAVPAHAGRFAQPPATIRWTTSCTTSSRTAGPLQGRGDLHGRREL